MHRPKAYDSVGFPICVYLCKQHRKYSSLHKINSCPFPVHPSHSKVNTFLLFFSVCITCAGLDWYNGNTICAALCLASFFQFSMVFLRIIYLLCLSVVCSFLLIVISAFCEYTMHFFSSFYQQDLGLLN